MLTRILSTLVFVFVVVLQAYGYFISQKKIPSCSIIRRPQVSMPNGNPLIVSASKGLSGTEDIMLGAPHNRRPSSGTFTSARGIEVNFDVKSVADPDLEVNEIVELIDNEVGVLLTSSYEFPGRYSRWTVGFVAPALQIEGKSYDFSITPLNERGIVLARMIKKRLAEEPNLFELNEFVDSQDSQALHKARILGRILTSATNFAEEDRSKQPSLFSLIRSIKDMFYSPEAGQLGLYGALGYDLTFQFEPIKLKKERGDDQRDLVIFLPDEVLVVDNQKKDSWRISYDFTDLSSKEKTTTRGLQRIGTRSEYSFAPANAVFQKRDLERGKYAESVIRAKEEFRVGNLFEVVLSQSFREGLDANSKPSKIFKRLCRRNPSPYGFFMNLGSNEYLVGASPEMFVRVENTAKGMRVETCPISGTIERGGDPLEDAQQIKKLLLSAKEESELTMCTDVDRNDKSRICEPGSVKVLGRRQIEMYSRLIHTVDHVEGYLRKGFDALDAFLCHTWAVTVTGAPKTWAIRFIEEMEPSVRHWYGGAVGSIGFDGTMNTGLTLRTIRIKDGIAEVRAGATLLHDSDPDAEEAETELKASALIDAISREDEREEVTKGGNFKFDASDKNIKQSTGHQQYRVLLVDHEDSFVHTLANYLRQTGAEVVTCRNGSPLAQFISTEVDTGKFIPNLAVLSPGPGSPSDFSLSSTIESMMSRRIPIFGVCLGLQGLVEYFGGELGVLEYPMHGKPSVITRTLSDDSLHSIHGDVLSGLPKDFQVARYHSLHGKKHSLPKDLIITATSYDEIVMAIQHSKYPIAAVQFHPESILTLPKYGMKIISNALSLLKTENYPSEQ